MRALYQSLVDADPVRLRTVARYWDVDLGSGRPNDLAARLAQAMAEPEAVRRAWEALPDEQRLVLQSLLAAGGRSPQRAFARRWGEIRAMGPGRMEREEPWRAPVSPAEGLWYRGFVFAAFDQAGSEFFEVVYAPPELRALLPQPPAAPAAMILPAAAEPAYVQRWGDALQDDACTVLAYLQNEPVRAALGAEWPAPHRAQLARQLRAADPERLAFLLDLMVQSGLLRLSDTQHLRPEAAPVSEWLQASSSHQRMALASAWRQSPTWNDLYHVATLVPEETGAWRNDALLSRRAIVHHLAACAPLQWYAVSDFVSALRETDPDFQRPSGDYDAWYIRDALSGEYLRGFASWEAVEGGLVRYMIAAPLAWLGLLDLGSEGSSTPPCALRVTPDGAAFFGSAELPAVPAPAALRALPDFTVSVPAAARYERFQLARIADWLRTADPYLYRLTPTSLERGSRQGIAVTRILEFLGRGLQAPVPRYLEAALTRWEARGSEASIEHTVVLRLASEELMAQVVASPFTRGLLREQIGPTAALLRQRDWPEMVVGLGKLGLLPDVREPGEGPH